MATILVTSAGDTIENDGEITLREAVLAADTNSSIDGSIAGEPGFDTIQFDPSLDGTPIVLNSQLLAVESLIVEGNGAGVTRISGGGATRIFSLSAGPAFQHFELRGLSLTSAMSTSSEPGQPEGFGGAVRVLGNGNTRLIVRNSLISGNESNVGGAIHVDQAHVVIDGSTFTNNAADFGGALSLQNVTAVITNSTIDSNRATRIGGGIDHFSGVADRTSIVDLVNVTLTDNDAEFGRNLRNSSQAGNAIMRYRNTIVAGGQGGEDFLNDMFGVIGSANSISLGHNLLDFAASGDRHPTDLIVSRGGIGLAPLALNGGSVPTRELHPLSFGVDAGSNDLAVGPGFDLLLGTADDEPLQTDQRGEPFVRQFDAGSGTATVDIGAFERQDAIAIPENLVVTSSDDDPFRRTTIDPLDLQLREAMQLANLHPRPDVITFRQDLNGRTIRLAGVPIHATDSVQILGPGADQLTLSGDRLSRVLDFGKNGDTSDRFVIDGLTLTDGLAFNGGAIYSRNNTLLIRDSVIQNSEATRSGGGMFAFATKVNVLSSTFAENTAANNGGGVSLVDSTSSFTNATLSGNRAIGGGGGGLFVFGERISVTDIASSTFAENVSTAAADVGGSARDNVLQHTLRIANSIFASTGGNQTVARPDESSPTEIISLGNNLAVDEFITDPHPSDLVESNPRLGALTVGAGGIGVHIPLPGSPARDNGDEMLLPLDFLDADRDGTFNEPLPLDAQGNARQFDLASVIRAGARSLDIGAVEAIDDPASFSDYGDAPDPPYPTTGTTAPRHVVGDLYLGQSIDADLDGLPTSNADGDGPDDDGVLFLTSLLVHPTVETFAGVRVTSSGNGFLDGWIDFNGDGDWTDPREQVIGGVAVEVGEQFLTFAVPAGTQPGTTVARFRLNSTASLPPDTGAASDGEIEDYRVTLVESVDQLEIEIPPGIPLGIVADTPNLVIAAGGSPIVATPASSVNSVRLVGTEGDDVIRLSNLGGKSSTPVSIVVDGKEGNDQLILTTMRNGSVESQVSLLGIEESIASREFEDAVTLSPAIVDVARGPGALAFIDVDHTDAVGASDGWQYSHSTIIGGRFARVVRSGATELAVLGPTEWTNPVEKHDVDRSGEVTALDALVIINQLSSRFFLQPGLDSLVDPLSITFPNLFFDTTEDGLATALDALRVINFLARQSLSGEAEHVPRIGVDVDSEKAEAHDRVLTDLNSGLF